MFKLLNILTLKGFVLSQSQLNNFCCETNFSNKIVLQNKSFMNHPNQARRRRLTLNFTLSFVLFSTVILDALLAYNFLLHLLCQDPHKVEKPQKCTISTFMPKVLFLCKWTKLTSLAKLQIETFQSNFNHFEETPHNKEEAADETVWTFSCNERVFCCPRPDSA